MEKTGKKKTTQTGSFKAEGSVYDVINDSGQMVFLKWDGSKQEQVGATVEVGGKIYETPFQYTPKNLSLPTGPGTNQTAIQLFEQSRNLIRSVFRTQDERVYSLLATYCLATYLFDSYSNVSYVEVSGPPGTGKSRLNHTAHFLCFNSWGVNGSITDAALFRYIDKLAGTLVMDESQRSFTDIASDRHKILTEGFSKQGNVSRCESNKKDGTTEPRSYSVFGPKIFAGRAPENEEAIASRCSLSLKLRTIEKAKNLQVADVDDEQWQAGAAKFRNDALLYRQRRQRKDLSPPGVDGSALTEGFSGRQLQVSKWLLDEAPTTEAQKQLVSLSLESWASQKKARGDTTEGVIAQTTAYLLETRLTARVTFAEIVSVLKREGYSSISPKAVSRFFSYLGVETGRANAGRYANVPSLEAFKKRCEDYGVASLGSTLATLATLPAAEPEAEDGIPPSFTTYAELMADDTDSEGGV